MVVLEAVYVPKLKLMSGHFHHVNGMLFNNVGCLEFAKLFTFGGIESDRGATTKFLVKHKESKSYSQLGQ